MTGGVAITGASGFIGRAINRHFPTARRLGRVAVPASDGLDIPYDLEKPLPVEALQGVECLIHCAAKVHCQGAEQHFDQLNRAATERLLHTAQEAGVKRVIFLSTLAVYGKHASPTPLRVDSPLDPQTPYARTKLQAEDLIRTLCQSSDMVYTIIRLPLVYGFGAPGNFGRLVRLAQSPLPLPFQREDNRRSMAYVENLADFIAYLCQQRACCNQTVLFSDGSDFSTAQLVSELRAALGRPARLLPLPKSGLQWLLTLSGRKRWYQQLYQSLLIEPDPQIRQSGWQPPFTPSQGVRQSL